MRYATQPLAHPVLLARGVLQLACSLLIAIGLSQCTTTSVRNADIVVSVKDQKLGYYDHGQLRQSFKISTSKFGIGDAPNSCKTPLGRHEVLAKIGHGLPKGAVLKSRSWNGEVLPPNAPGRDPIVSRIMWLGGMERSNQNAYRRFIYIHGTTEENLLGRPASYGCVRMSMADVIKLFNEVNIGAQVVITQESLPVYEPVVASSNKPAVSPASSAPPIDLTPTSIASPASASPVRSSPAAEPSEESHSMPVPISSYSPSDPRKQRLVLPVGHAASLKSRSSVANTSQRG